MLSKSTKKIFNYSFGTLLCIWLCYSLYHQLANKSHLHLSLQRVQQSFRDNWPALLLVMLLMGVNWAIEARKWQILVRPFESLSFRKAFYSILAGVSISIITPNRIGEYGGRILYLKNKNRLRGVSVTGVGSLSQFTTTMLFGLLGCLYFMYAFEPITIGDTKNGMLWEVLFTAMVAGLLTAGLALYYHLDKLVYLFGASAGYEDSNIL